MVRTSSGIVAGLTATALAVIGFLTYQASASAPSDLSTPRATESLPATATASKAPRDRKHPTALPAGSGTSRRVVYSLDDDRVWLVEQDDRVRRTFRVSPGTVDPPPGRYVVTSRSGTIVGSDGVAVEHVVRFASLNGIAIGFSAAADGSATPPDPTKKLGGIRESKESGTATWDFATIGTRVVVIK
ncbi:L,D-transpeptidase [Streptomyces aurantiacus]|uniref:L,D-transpeptidase n=1 Tax=Streptomyces aurantiacus TaxID=47760 RepID=UPI0006E3AFE6|nr:L,D-transpeptidase [Streptomyces aurantiacus]